MDTLACPHCGAVISTAGSFCASCGKALPAPTTGPRIVDSADAAQTRLGLNLQVEALGKQTRKAAGALLLVAILQAVFGTILLIASRTDRASVQAVINVGVIAIALYGVAALFFGLAIWARSSPFPAAIAGLVIFVTLHLIDAIADPTAIVRGIILKIIIIVVLVRAIKAGAKHRALLRQMGQN